MKLKQLGKGELSRIIHKQSAMIDQAKEELQRWLDGFIVACKEIVKLDPDNEFVKQLPDSTKAQVYGTDKP